MIDAITVVTTLGEPQWQAYANRSMPSWFEHMPADTEFHLHTDRGFRPLTQVNIRYFDDTPQKQHFVLRNLAADRRAPDHFHPVGKRWNIYHHKIFAQYESYRACGTRWMLFLDADVAMLQQFSVAVLRDWLAGRFCGYMGRDPLLTETGLLAYDLAADHTDKFFVPLIKLYTEDGLFALHSWDDCGAFDHVRETCGLAFENLSGQHAHFIDPIAVGKVGEYFDHWISGKSKRQGFSKHRKFRGRV